MAQNRSYLGRDVQEMEPAEAMAYWPTAQDPGFFNCLFTLWLFNIAMENG